MSSPKCRCGSDDKIVFDNGQILRASDNKPHICLDEIDKVPEYKNTIEELNKTVTGLLEHNKYLESKIALIH